MFFALSKGLDYLTKKSMKYHAYFLVVFFALVVLLVFLEDLSVFLVSSFSSVFFFFFCASSSASLTLYSVIYEQAAAISSYISEGYS